MPAGRPSKYNEKLAEEICKRIATGNKGLRRICRAEDMPDVAQVIRWLNEFPQFRAQYQSAKEEQADHLVDECIEIADDGTNDTYELDDGSKKVAHDHIQRSKLRVEQRRWQAARLAARKWGDKVTTEITGADGSPVKFIVEIVEAKK